MEKEGEKYKLNLFFGCDKKFFFAVFIIGNDTKGEMEWERR
jgi:hypothetical protein